MAVGTRLAAPNGLQFRHPKRHHRLNDDPIARVKSVGDFGKLVIDAAERLRASPLADEADPRSRNADVCVEPKGEKIG